MSDGLPTVIQGRHFTASDPPPRQANTVFSACRFSGLSFRGDVIDGLRFLDCRFETVCFLDCPAESLEWTRCELTNVHWRRGSLRDSQFHDSELRNCSWRECALEGLHFSNARCRDLILETLEARHLAVVASEMVEVRIDACRLIDCSWIRGRHQQVQLIDGIYLNLVFGQLESECLSCVSCSGRNLRFIQCEVRGAELRDCEFEQASWSHALLADSKIQQTKLLTAGFERSRLNGVKISDTSLANTQFDAAEISRCRFERVEAPRISLRTARLDKVSFSDIDFQQLDARGATLEGVTFQRAICRAGRLDGQSSRAWEGADTSGSRFDDLRLPLECDWWRLYRPGIRNTGTIE